MQNIHCRYPWVLFLSFSLWTLAGLLFQQVAFANEAPSVDDQGFSIAENSANDSFVGTVAATDADTPAQTLFFAVTGGTGQSVFALALDTGQITVADSSQLDFETATSFTLDVEVTDDGEPNLSDTATITLNINDVNEPPTAVNLTSTTNSLAEDAATTSAIKMADIVVADDALGTVTLSLSGADADSFEIVGSELRLKALTSLDYETKTSLAVTVEVDDVSVGASPDVTTEHTLVITDVNEAPTAVSLSNPTTSLAEDTDTTSAIKMADIVVSDDALGTETLSLSGADADSFEIVGSELYLVAEASLDFETQTSFAVTVEVDDASVGANPDVTAAHTLTITDINEAPTAVTLTNATTILAEDTDNTSALKMADIVVTDDALGTETLNLSGADADSFEIVGTELRLIAGAGLDYESQTSFAVTVEVDDDTVGATPDVTADHTLTITDVNEAPTAVSLTDTTTSLAENTDTTGAIKMADINVEDDALGTETLSLSGVDAGSFEMVGNELYLVAEAILDFETQTSFAVTVQVDDASVGATPDATVSHTLSFAGHPIVLLSIYFIIIFKYYNYRHLYHSIILGRTSPYSL